MGFPAFRRSSVVRPSSICIPFLWSILAASIVFPSPALAQSAVKRRLITAPIQDESTTTLRGNTYPLARAEFDRGAAPLDLPIRRMLLVLKRGPEQETSLEGLLDQQQAKGSPSYHSWLTPEQFGQQFGPADEDIQEITSWLQSHGFAVTRVSTGRTVIEFSGTASQVQNAFHTEIHKYVVNGVERWANASDPAIPSALSAAVAGIDTLHNFPRKWLHRFGGLYTKSKETGPSETSRPDSRAVIAFHSVRSERMRRTACQLLCAWSLRLRNNLRCSAAVERDDDTHRWNRPDDRRCGREQYQHAGRNELPHFRIRTAAFSPRCLQLSRRLSTIRGKTDHRSFLYSDFAATRMGMSGSASFQSVRNSL